ncbi:MAG: NAD(P)-dependent oxidoreductase [Pseudomonadota bacterium]
MTKPIVLVHPPFPTFEPMLSAYEVVHLGDAKVADAAAALTVGSQGIPNATIEAMPKLKLIVGLGVGVEGLDLDFLRARGVAVTNGAGVNHEDVADIAIGLMIGVARRFPEGLRLTASGAWKPPLACFPQRRLKGMKLGIVGMGAIGRAIAARAEALGLVISWTGPHSKPDVALPHESDLLKLAEWADMLVLSLPGGKTTDKLIDARVLAALGEDGILINVARGSIVDEDALIAALKAGKLWGAGLDVYAEEPTPPERWAGLNVMLTPHLGGGTRDAVIAVSQNALENLRRFFAGEELLTPVR